MMKNRIQMKLEVLNNVVNVKVSDTTDDATRTKLHLIKTIS
jgi:hypothetical protein